MVTNGHSPERRALETVTAPACSSVTLTIATSSTCCPSRFPTYTEAMQEQEKKKKKKNNPVPPWLKPKMRDL